MVSQLRPDTPSSASSSSSDTASVDQPTTSSSLRSLSFGTRAIHVGSDANEETGAVIPPISLSTTYKQSAIGVHKGFEYTRSDNPNRRALETLLASIEAGGSTALTFSSGSAATSTIITSLGPNAHVLSVNDVYGGTFRYMTRVASVSQNLATTFVDLENSSDDEVRAAFRPETKLVWIESPTNPTLRVIDIPRIVRLAKEAPSRPLVLVDNTFLSPFYQSPLVLGADVVLHSITKYINGHSDVLMGALILAPSTPSPSPPTTNPTETLEEKLRFLQNAAGAVPSPYDTWLTQRGAKTLHLRMKAHGTNALAVARWLHTSGRELGLVKEAVYPGLRGASRGRFDLVKGTLLGVWAKKWIEKGVWEGAGGGEGGELEGVPYGGMVSFRIAPYSPPLVSSASSTSELDDTTTEPEIDPTSSAERFLTSSHIFTLAESLGGVESLAELPEKMTHGSIPPAERLALGITGDLVRLSVGVEDVEDILFDLEKSLRWAVRGEVWDGISSGKVVEEL